MTVHGYGLGYNTQKTGLSGGKFAPGPLKRSEVGAIWRHGASCPIRVAVTRRWREVSDGTVRRWHRSMPAGITFGARVAA